MLELLQLYASFLKIAGADAVHSKGFDVYPSGDDRLDCLVRSAKHATSSTHLRSAGRCGLRFWRTASGGAIGPRTSAAIGDDIDVLDIEKGAGQLGGLFQQAHVHDLIGHGYAIPMPNG